MRMHLIKPELLCNQHLLGEHGELHKFRHIFEKGHSIAGRLDPEVQIVPNLMQVRHDELAEEMLRRGMNHKSPYIQPELHFYWQSEIFAQPDIIHNAEVLCFRCDDCFRRINDAFVLDWEREL